MSHYLYKHYDKSGQLLYVGITNNLRVRHVAHKRDSFWFLDIARFKSNKFDTKREAVAAEIEAIRELRPLHNVTYSVDADGNQLSAETIQIKRSIRLAIARSGKKQHEIANEVGVTQMAISHWQSEKLDKLPRLLLIEPFCKSVGIRPDELFETFREQHREQSPPVAYRQHSHDRHGFSIASSDD